MWKRLLWVAAMESKKSTKNVSKKLPEIKVDAVSPRKTRNKKSTIKEEKVEVLSPYFSNLQKTSVINQQSQSPSTATIDKKVELKTEDLKSKKRTHITIKTEPSTIKEEVNEAKVSKWEPLNWRNTLRNLQQMRETTIAPVDEMGCAKCSDEVDEKLKRYQILVSLMLSSQTKDQVTYDAMQRLRAHGLTPQNIVETDESVLEKLLNPVSFYRNKTKFLKKVAQILIEKYDSDIPNNLNELIKLPGVGPKMAHLTMTEAWGQVTGIGVDTHVHRISNRLRWVQKPTKDPEQTRVALEKWLPYELWDEINLLLVGFGQTICTPTYPKCDICSNNEICPSREYRKKSPKKSPRK